MKIIQLFALFMISLSLFGQEKLFVSDYDWDSTPNYNLNIESDKPMMALKEQYVTEFAYGKDNNFTEHYLEHKALWLNSNDKIEDYNKIYLPYSSTSELVLSKARVITKSGKVIDLDDSKILSAQDEETGNQYKYFALEGVEKGSIIEYLYVEKKNPSYSGTAFRLQSDFDKKDVTFDLFSPSNLLFDFRTYNGLPQVSRDTLSKDRLHWKLTVNELEALEMEDQAPYTASRGYLIYKLDKNLKTGKSDLSSYGSVAQNIYNYYYSEPSKKAQELIDAFLVSINGKGNDLEKKIRALDNKIKSSFILSESSGESLKNLEEILEKKVANTTGMIKLYVALLQQIEAKHEVVVTCDRTKLKFDKEFEAHNFLSEFLIYFPEFKTYLSPTDMASRYGFPPAYLTDNYGLFVKEVSLGDFKSGVGKIKYIDSVSEEKTTDTMVIDVTFDEGDITKNSITLSRAFAGYYGLPIHPYMSLIVGDDRKNALESLAKTMNENVTIENADVFNEDPELFGVKPITFVMDITSDAFVEKAGNKYLFKIGELIGAQIEMYQEKKRVLPLENEFKRSYFRTINIKLPEGYKVANPEDLNIDKKYQKDGKELFSFISTYEINNGLLSITADEHYRTNLVDPSIFEEFRSVINSAADFNKIVLILEPKA